MICKECGNVQEKKKIGFFKIILGLILAFAWWPLIIFYLFIILPPLRKCNKCGKTVYTKEELKIVGGKKNGK